MATCKDCKHGVILYKLERDRQTREVKTVPCGRIECSSPKYGKRKYIVKDKPACAYYAKRERQNAESQEG